MDKLIELLVNRVHKREIVELYGDNSHIEITDIKYITNNKSLLIELKLFFSDINSLEIVKDDGVKYLIDESWKITGFDNINISILVDYNLL